MVLEVFAMAKNKGLSPLSVSSVNTLTPHPKETFTEAAVLAATNIPGTTINMKVTLHNNGLKQDIWITARPDGSSFSAASPIQVDKPKLK